MIKVTLTNEILRYIIEIEQNRYKVSSVKLSKTVMNKLRKNSKKKSSYASNKIEGNPLSEKQVNEVIESDERKHYLKPEQEVRNYFLALNFLEEKVKNKEKFSKKLILDVQKLVENGASKEKIGLRGPMPPGVLFAVYDSKTGNPDYIPPEYCDIPGLLDELVEYVNTTDDHPLIVAAVVHYQLVTIHPFEDGNGFRISYLFTYVRDFIFNGSYYHLWFLPALMLADVIVYYLYKKKGLKFTLITTFALYVVGYLINVYTPVWESLPYISFLFGFFTKALSTARNGIFFGPMFIAIGLLLSRTRRLPKKVSLLAFLISFVLLFCEVALYRYFNILRDLTSMYICLVPAVYFLVNYLLKVNIPYRKMFTILRHDSLMIYTSHILFAKIFLVLMPHAHLVVYFLTLACAQCLAGFVTRYQDQYPILKKLL